jgi:hypothetical protein
MDFALAIVALLLLAWRKIPSWAVVLLTATLTMKAMPDGRSIRQGAKLDPEVVDSLEALIDHGTFKSLSLRWCSALYSIDRERLQAAARRYRCRLTLP